MKRYQVLLEDWQEAYVENLAAQYDLSLSEVIRLEVCFAIISTTLELCPDYKPGMRPKEILEEAQQYHNKGSEHDFHKLLSKIYFEARKASEFRAAQTSKKG